MRSMLACACLVAAALLYPSAGIASNGSSEEQPLRAISQPIVNGLLTSAFPSVAALLDVSGPEPFAFCTGTLIGCQTVLTAAHCFCGTETPGSLCQADPTNKLVFLQHNGYFPIESVAINPSYQFGVGSDVAIVRLGTPVNGVSPTPINTLSRPPFGAAGLIAGFGRTGGTSQTTGIKRVGSVATADCSIGPPNAKHLCWIFDSPVGPPGLDSNICQGDSGGPLFADAGSGLRVVGVTSGFGPGGNECLAPTLAFDADVFVERLWIQGQAGADLNNTTCGDLPQAGSPSAPINFAAGALSSANPDDRYTLEVPGGSRFLGVTLNGDAGDFDLYLKAGSPPTTTDFDCKSDFAGSFEGCGIANPAAGTWHLLADHFGGTGLYQLTATTFLGGGGGGPCVADANTLCLLDERFRVRVNFRPPNEISRPANAIPFTERAGLFWFFNQNNVEMLIKVLNACAAPFNRYWVFFAATTNVEYEVIVEDTQHPGVERRYTNPQGMVALPVADTQAFATCP